MFEFLFKRPGDKPDDAAPGQADPSLQGAAPQSPAGLARAQQAEKVAGLRGDEAGAADFILACDYAELRLAAAEFVHSRSQLERVHAGMRNTDRRVAKLMQSRLDAMRHHDAELARGQACLVVAQALVADDRLTPNQVAELDRKWSVIAAPELKDEFAQLRATLEQRLATQVALQRAMIDRLNLLRQLAASDMPAAELAVRLDQLAAEQALALAAPEHGTLPRSLTNEFSSEHARLAGALATRGEQQAAASAREAAAAAPAAPAPVARPKERKAAPEPDQSFLDKLAAMEQALQHGSLGTAADMDKALKDAPAVRLSSALQERLAHARAELKRLSDWARWGGNVSREELIKAVEQLPKQQLPMSELAKKVGSMRDRWKALDTLSGSAPKTLWDKFDAACSTAYAPAAAHFKHLSDERHTNAAKAEALIAEAQAETARLDGAQVDWKHLAQAVQHLRLGWSHLGAIDRKDKKRLDQLFADALNLLQAPLESQRKAEVASREDLIAQVGALNPQDRHSLDALRALQERWQEHARALPLERKSEQALWQRFRAACDAVFAKRKESAHAADAERRSHEDAKNAISARLESAVASDAASAAKLLRDAAAEWHAIGAVPRAHEARVEKRYQAAVAAVNQQAEAARRNAGMAQATALRDKLRLTQQLEAALAGNTDTEADWAGRWAALPALSADYERALKARFDAALAAFAGERAAYAAMLAANSSKLLLEILRLEIAAGIDSGSEFARDRLKLQVETLQSSLKSGHKPASQSAQFLALCAMPALVDDRTASRIGHLFARIVRDGK